jgi:casein kinase II subunit beta
MAEKKQPKHSVMSDTDSFEDSEKLHKSWIDGFMEQPSSDWFCRLPPAFANDGFNTFGLRIDQRHAKSAFAQLFVGIKESSDSSYDSDSEDEIDKCTERLFGLIHSRYIFTPEGLSEIYKKYQMAVFGTCPRYRCADERMLPVGLSDQPGTDTVKLYCPKCRQLYEADDIHRNLDGAYFTRSFAHYFLLELRQGKLQGPGERQSTDVVTPMTSEPQSTAKTFH